MRRAAEITRERRTQNKAEQEKIINGIVEEVGSIAADPDKLRQALLNSAIRDLTEYGRVVHAEMEALMCCARSHGTTRGGVLYCTTFPCHNCAKHIVAAGIERVVFIEPYAKSKALQLHEDSISLGFVAKRDTVRFEPFIGVGPRRFFDLFSMKLSSGYPLKRNDGAGNVISWELEKAKLRMQMRPCSYLDLELLASAMFDEHKEKMESPNEDQG